MNLPTVAEVEELHKKHAPSGKAFGSVWTHSKIVADIARKVCESYPEIDAELVNIGALLHDIGVYKLYRGETLDTSEYATHGWLGCKLLEEENYDEILCNFPLNHIGIGLTKEDVIKQKINIPVRDYVPTSEEEYIVLYADIFHSKTTPPQFNAAKTYKHVLVERFGEHKGRAFQKLLDKYGEPDLAFYSSKYGHEVV